eukprot:403340394
MGPRKKKGDIKGADAVSVNGDDQPSGISLTSDKLDKLKHKGNNDDEDGEDEVDQSEVATAGAADDDNSSSTNLQPPKKIRKKSKDANVADGKKSSNAGKKGGKSKGKEQQKEAQEEEQPADEEMQEDAENGGGNGDDSIDKANTPVAANAPPKESKDNEEAGQEEQAAEEEEEEQEEEQEEEDEEEETKDTNTGGAAKSTVPKRPKTGPGSLNEPKKMMNDQEAEQAIAEFMEKQNRPYSVQNILDSFQQRIKKTQCQKIMDELTTSQILTCKEYGKAKIYLINQDVFETTTNEELQKLDDQIKVRKDEYDLLIAEYKQLQSRLKEVSQGQSNTDMKTEIKNITKDIQTSKVALEPFISGGRKLVTQAEITKADAALKKIQQEWKKRRRACNDIVDQISESAEMNRKDFIKKLGLETDEMYNVVCPI